MAGELAKLINSVMFHTRNTQTKQTVKLRSESKYTQKSTGASSTVFL